MKGLKQFSTVFKFEYSSYIKSKAFLIVTIIVGVLLIAGGSVPNIVKLFSSLSSDDKDKEMKKAVICADAALYTQELVNAYMPGYEWSFRDSLTGVEAEVERGDIEMAVSVDGLNYTVYTQGSKLLSFNFMGLSDMVTRVYKHGVLAQIGLNDAESEALLMAQAVPNIVSVGKDLTQSFWVGYAMLFMLFYCIMLYGQYISMSVVTEKTSKAMELLITSAKPLNLMFGKVMGAGCAGLTQFGTFVVVIVAAFKINQSAWLDFAPVVNDVINMSFSSGIFIYAIIFFLLGFFSFSFIYAAAGSTVSRVEDAQVAVTIPMLLILVSFFGGMYSMYAPDAGLVKVLAYVPFISPFIGFVRICVADVSVLKAISYILPNIVYIWAAGYVSTKIYRVGVMLYGNVPKIKDLVRFIRHA